MHHTVSLPSYASMNIKYHTDHTERLLQCHYKGLTTCTMHHCHGNDVIMHHTHHIASYCGCLHTCNYYSLTVTAQGLGETYSLQKTNILKSFAQ